MWSCIWPSSSSLEKAGFTIAEIKLLFHGFQEGTPASDRWRGLAGKKLHELDLLILRMKSMQKLLRSSLRCRCIRLEDCGRALLFRSGRKSP
jgi:DNA-binding transcriptional MerR regulator